VGHSQVSHLSQCLDCLLSQGHHHLRIERCSNLENLSLRENQIPDASPHRISQASNNYIYPTIRFLTIIKGREWSRWVDITLS